MGDVYEAEDTRLNRRVAVKVLPPAVSDHPERRQRFEREARAIAALKHPGIVTIHSIEQARGRLFLTMELVEGRTLSQAIPSRGFPLAELLELAIPLADAIHAAHRQGVIHRDLKPANIMIADGAVKILDFGLAQLTSVVRDEAVTMLQSQQLTAEGSVMGTVAYMSPEQAQGLAVDVRSDIFSLGIVLFEMASGERPFQGDTPISTLSSIVKDPAPSLSAANPSVPAELVRIVRRTLVRLESGGSRLDRHPHRGNRQARRRRSID
jgi:serine/threonine protein kinase